MMKTLFNIFLLVAVLMACQKKAEKDDHQSESHAKSDTEKHDHWSYSGETGPEHWAEIEKKSDCGGEFQSPVNIITVDATLESDPIFKSSNFHYENKTHIKSVTNNGHSIQFNFDSDSNFIVYDDIPYQLIQFHFHSPSEHTINGVRYPLEIHLVHKSKQNEYTVIGVMAEEGVASETFTFLESYFPISVGETKEIDKYYGFHLTFPEATHEEYYAYHGSLTTPPCSETVNWIVYREPLTLSEAQVIALQELMPLENYRDIQPLNERKVVKSFD